jgi:hypothetical protein
VGRINDRTVLHLQGHGIAVPIHDQGQFGRRGWKLRLLISFVNKSSEVFQ